MIVRFQIRKSCFGDDRILLIVHKCWTDPSKYERSTYILYVMYIIQNCCNLFIPNNYPLTHLRYLYISNVQIR